MIMMWALGPCWLQTRALLAPIIHNHPTITMLLPS